METDAESVVAEKQYKGLNLAHICKVHTYTDHHGEVVSYANYHVTVDGRGTYYRLSNDPKKAFAYAIKQIDTYDEDNRIRSDITSLISEGRDFTVEVEASSLKVGDVACVYATGRGRVGRVIKVGKKNATVAYTTPSSKGRIYRKSASRVFVRQENHSVTPGLGVSWPAAGIPVSIALDVV